MTRTEIIVELLRYYFGQYRTGLTYINIAKSLLAKLDGANVCVCKPLPVFSANWMPKSYKFCPYCGGKIVTALITKLLLWSKRPRMSKSKYVNTPAARFSRSKRRRLKKWPTSADSIKTMIRLLYHAACAWLAVIGLACLLWLVLR